MTYPQRLITAPEPVKLTVEDYLMLEAAGAFRHYSRTELIEGEIVGVNAQQRPHVRVKVTLLRRLADACERLGRGLEAWSEGSIDMSPHNMPEPDLFVTRAGANAKFFTLAELALVGEVSDTSLERDLRVKKRLYARMGVPEYWVADVNGRVIHQFWDIGDDGYAEARETPFGEPLHAMTVDGLVVETAGL
jgi:Uma2 family endonuclease